MPTADKDRVGADLLAARIPPLYPPKFLAEHVLPDIGGVEVAASRMEISVRELREILTARKKIDGYVASKLATGTPFSREFWLNLQAAYDLSENAGV